MTINVYTTPTCPYCKSVKDFLTEKAVDFKEINVADDNKTANDMVKLSGQMGVPVVEINGEIIVGWNKELLEEKLKQKA